MGLQLFGDSYQIGDVRWLGATGVIYLVCGLGKSLHPSAIIGIRRWALRFGILASVRRPALIKAGLDVRDWTCCVCEEGGRVFFVKGVVPSVLCFRTCSSGVFVMVLRVHCVADFGVCCDSSARQSMRPTTSWPKKPRRKPATLKRPSCWPRLG